MACAVAWHPAHVAESALAVLWRLREQFLADGGTLQRKLAVFWRYSGGIKRSPPKESWFLYELVVL
ncbi:hypothetical protein Hthe01_18660 [Hydrogenophilus thermoluteolus]|nr:hypothetical protein Hthe01_18660 [Hydrogenophilus thermoluteolus]